MKITSVYLPGRIMIEKGRTIVNPIGIEEQGFTIEICVGRIGFERFRFLIKLTDVSLPNLNTFVEEFDEFILDRSRTPYLVVSHESSTFIHDPCYLKFAAEGLGVVLEYHISGEGLISHRHTTSGTFEVGQEYLLQILAGLRDLIETPRGDQADETDWAAI